MNAEIPIVEVYESEQTYEMVLALYNDMQRENNINLNRPQSPLQRILVNVVGFVALNAVTFLVTDIIRGAVTGKRPGIWWFFYGPWYYITSAPLINRIVTVRRFFKELKDGGLDIKPTDEEKFQHEGRCNDDFYQAEVNCCFKNGGDHWNEYDENGRAVPHCDFHWTNPIGESQYKKCRAKAEELEKYCLSFPTDALYDRALKMYEDHPYIFDLFYLFNYGTLPPTVDLPFWWPF